MASVIELILFFLVFLPLFYGSIVVKRFQELRPHYYSYQGNINVRSQMDTHMLVKVEFSKNKNFNKDDCIIFDFRIKDSINIFFIPPDTLYVEGSCEIASGDNFNIIGIDSWPYQVRPHNDYCEYLLHEKYIEYRDSVLLGSKKWIRLNNF